MIVQVPLWALILTGWAAAGILMIWALVGPARRQADTLTAALDRLPPQLRGAAGLLVVFAAGPVVWLILIQRAPAYRLSGRSFGPVTLFRGGRVAPRLLGPHYLPIYATRRWMRVGTTRTAIVITWKRAPDSTGDGEPAR